MSEVLRWIFAYGSLVWRPAFQHLERRPAWVRGWVRRFWQGSTDHRGVPGAPGRVVTLHPSRESLCWGAAYRVEPAEMETILGQLDFREQGGYQRVVVPLHFPSAAAGKPPTRALMYVATPDNPNYLGAAPLEQIARQVRRSRGPSGANCDYVLRLAASLREMGASDEHVFALEELILQEPGP